MVEITSEEIMMPATATSLKFEPRSVSRGWIIAGTIVLFLTLITILALTVNESVALISIGTLLVLVFAFTHGVLRYGLRTMVIFLVAVVVIGWSYESLSIQTGFPFGDYYYTSGMGAKIGQVPVAIMPSYFAFGYLSWTIASILLRKRDDRISGSDLWAMPIVASFVMVMWDLCMDPVCSTILNEWIWEDGGDYFGVPLTNFFGWFLTVFTFYFLFSLYLRLTKGHTDGSVITGRAFWILPTIMYVSIAIDFWGLWLRGAPTETVTDQSGQVWQTSQILGSVVLISVFTMIFVTILSLILIRRDDVKPAAP
jgi:putative membrane protein